MKSLVMYLQGLYSAMFLDIAEQFPALRRDSERDASRLLSLVESRGLPFLMVDLPDAGKHFDRSLSDGRLTRFCMAGFRPYRKRGVIPRLFKGLLLRVFDENGVLRAVPDVQAIRALRQLLYAAKKFKVACDDSRTWEHVHEFFETDSEVRLPSLDWDRDVLVTSVLRDLDLSDPDSSSDAPLFSVCNSSSTEDRESLDSIRRGLAAAQRVCDRVTAELGAFSGLDWRAKHGPGAVADQRHTQFKYDFPNWPAKLEESFPMADFGFPNHAGWAAFLTSAEARTQFSLHEPPSKLIAVPKTLKGPRLIAAEPTAHQWCQQTILDYFTSRLSNTLLRNTVHFRDQSRNQELAKRASHTRSHVTVDLSSASDRLSCWVVERVFRRSESLVRALHSSRTRWVRNDIDAKSPQFCKLRKFACMGSACTFPVQSISFACLAIGALVETRFGRGQSLASQYKAMDRLAQEVLVFGDDIIIPGDAWNLLQGMLGSLGLKVNQQKTYENGNFRESCGCDAYDGHDVTPVYIKSYPEVSRPDSVVSSLQTHNNLALQGWERVAEGIKSRVRSLKRFVFMNVPPDSGAFGWVDIDCVGNPKVERRWNSDLQRVELRVDIPYGRTARVLPKSDSVLLQYFTVARTPPAFLAGDRLGHALRSTSSIRRRWVPLPI